MSCPLCASEGQSPAWWGTTTFKGATYTYLACASCGSASCDPMPADHVLRAMYGPDYESLDGEDTTYRSDAEVIALVRSRPSGRFLDIGCGAGKLLREVASSGWTVLGVEIHPEVAARAAAATGCEVLTPSAADGVKVDIVHLGDVLEHLPDPAAGIEEAVRHLGKNGLLVAQGPLEANRHLFLWLLRLTGFGRPRVGTGPPYHVLLATADGQERLFRRAGLRTVRFDVTEVAWPAPPTLQACHGRRDIALWVARRASLVFTRMVGRRFGNRYLYVGAWDG